MSQKITINVHLYGIFHRYYPGQDAIKLQVSSPYTLRSVIEELCLDIQKKNPQLSEVAVEDVKQIIESSVFACDEHILHDADNYFLKDNVVLAILPPVCGG